MQYLQKENRMLRQAFDPATYPRTSDLRRNREWAKQRAFEIQEAYREVLDKL